TVLIGRIDCFHVLSSACRLRPPCPIDLTPLSATTVASVGLDVDCRRGRPAWRGCRRRCAGGRRSTSWSVVTGCGYQASLSLYPRARGQSGRIHAAGSLESVVGPR